MALVLRRLVPLVFLALLWAPAAYAWSWPVHGSVLQGFSFDPAHPYAAGQHRGIDIGASGGASVLAPAAGTVTFAGSVPTSGTSLTILTVDGYSVTLTHLGALAVARGTSVAEGDVVGAVGPSGAPEVEGPYVHLGIRLAADPNGYLDPLTLLPAPEPSAPPDSAAPPAGSSAAPAETTPAPPVAAPAPPAPAPVASVPSATPPTLVPAVPAARTPTATPVAAPVAEAPASRSTRAAGEGASVSTHPHLLANAPAPRAERRPAGDRPSRGGEAHARTVRQPDPVAVESTPLRHRPVPVAAPVREAAIGETEFPTVSLALGAGVAALLLAALFAGLRLRRRPLQPPASGAVVISLPQRRECLEERRVA